MTKDDKTLTKVFAELEKQPRLVQELNQYFVDMDGRKNKTEFSRCLTFFLLGRVFEKKELSNGNK